MTKEKIYPNVEDVLKATEETAPQGWTITHEYPDSVGVDHSTFTDDEFIMFGDVNGFFGFNDSLDVCGYMEELTDPKEIAISFWEQIRVFYPQLMEIELWIDGFSNSGTKIKTASIKKALEDFQIKYPERKYIIQRLNGFWYITREAK
jgi:hypothetical protein